MTARRCLLIVLVLTQSHALASGPKLAPMPEPVLGESVTDIDSTSAGELEIDLTGTRGLDRGNQWSGSVEIETRVTDRLGLELSVGYTQIGSDAFRWRAADVRLLASWSFFHDVDRGAHAQFEAGGRIFGDGDDRGNLGDPLLPLSAGLRLGVQRGWWTLRAGAGAAAGGTSAHAIPAWLSAALFVTPISPRLSLGIDGEADWTRPNVFTVAPTALLSGHLLGIDGRFALAALYGPGGGGRKEWFGMILRLILEFDLAADR